MFSSRLSGDVDDAAEDAAADWSPHLPKLLPHTQVLLYFSTVAD